MKIRKDDWLYSRSMGHMIPKENIAYIEIIPDPRWGMWDGFVIMIHLKTGEDVILNKFKEFDEASVFLNSQFGNK